MTYEQECTARKNNQCNFQKAMLELLIPRQAIHTRLGLFLKQRQSQKDYPVSFGIDAEQINFRSITVTNTQIKQSPTLKLT